MESWLLWTFRDPSTSISPTGSKSYELMELQFRQKFLPKKTDVTHITAQEVLNAVSNIQKIGCSPMTNGGMQMLSNIIARREAGFQRYGDMLRSRVLAGTIWIRLVPAVEAKKVYADIAHLYHRLGQAYDKLANLSAGSDSERKVTDRSLKGRFRPTQAIDMFLFSSLMRAGGVTHCSGLKSVVSAVEALNNRDPWG